MPLDIKFFIIKSFMKILSLIVTLIRYQIYYRIFTIIFVLLYKRIFYWKETIKSFGIGITSINQP